MIHPWRKRVAPRRMDRCDGHCIGSNCRRPHGVRRWPRRLPTDFIFRAARNGGILARSASCAVRPAAPWITLARSVENRASGAHLTMAILIAAPSVEIESAPATASRRPISTDLRVRALQVPPSRTPGGRRSRSTTFFSSTPRVPWCPLPLRSIIHVESVNRPRGTHCDHGSMTDDTYDGLRY